MKKILPVLLLACITALNTSAQKEEKDEMETDRPSESFSPEVVVKRRLQAEVGFRKEHDKTNGQSQDEYLYPTALLRYGLTKKFELRVLIEDEGEYEYNPDKQKVASGITPVNVGFKYNLLKEKGGLPNTSLIASAAIPKLASPDFKSDYIAPSFRLAMENSLSKKLSLTYNVGVEWEPEDVHASYIVSLCPELEVTDKFKIFAEVYSRFSSEESADHRWDAGLLYKILPNLQVDFYGGMGITKSAPDNFIEAGISFRLPH